MKKILIIAALAGAAWFYLKPKPEVKPEPTPEPKPEIKPKPKAKAKPKPPIAPPKQTKIIASDLALRNPDAVKNKKIYAINAGSGVYNYSSTAIGKTLKDEYMGIVVGLDRTSGGVYVLRYKTPTGQFNKIASTAVYLFN